MVHYDDRHLDRLLTDVLRDYGHGEDEYEAFGDVLCESLDMLTILRVGDMTCEQLRDLCIRLWVSADELLGLTDLDGI